VLGIRLGTTLQRACCLSEWREYLTPKFESYIKIEGLMVLLGETVERGGLALARDRDWWWL
jgi:hypothetical protein